MTYLPDKLLTKEVANLDKGAPLGDGAVDGEMGIHSTHLVQVTLDETFFCEARSCARFH